MQPKLFQLHWCLRYTVDEDEPFCTNDQATLVEGPVEGVSTLAERGMELLFHPETVVFFPLSWQVGGSLGTLLTHFWHKGFGGFATCTC